MAAIELFSTPLYNLATLKAYYRLEGNSNDAKDSHNGTDTNITYSTANGKFNQGAGFNGSTSTIQMTNGADFQPTGSFTMGAWFKLAATGGAYTIMASSSFNNAQTIFAGILLRLDSGGHLNASSLRNTGSVQGTDYQSVTGATAVSDTTTFHLGIFTWDGSTLTVWLDGNSDGTTSWGNAPGYRASNVVSIGARAVTDSGAPTLDFMNGAIDDCFFYNGYAWTSTDVSNYFNGTFGNPASAFFMM